MSYKDKTEWTPAAWYRAARSSAEAQAEHVRGMANLFLTHLESHLPGLPREEVARRLQESNRQRLDAVPDLTKYPELKGMREMVEAQWRGTRDGAGLDDALSAAYSDSRFYYHRYVSTGQAGSFGCSYVFFPTSEYGPILANNLDSFPTEPIGVPQWPMVSENLILGSVSSGVYLDEVSPEIFPAPVSQLVGQFCRTTDEAVEILERYNYFWGPCNMIVIDRDKNVAMIEKTSCRIGVRRSPDGFGYVTAMTAQDPALHAYLEDRRAASVKARNLPEVNGDVAYWKAQDRRGQLMNELLDESREEPTLEKLRSFIQFRCSERGNVCGNGDILFPGDPETEYTIKTTIFLLREGKALWWAKRDDRPSYENRQPDICFDDVPLWN